MRVPDKLVGPITLLFKHINDARPFGWEMHNNRLIYKVDGEKDLDRWCSEAHALIDRIQCAAL